MKSDFRKTLAEIRKSIDFPSPVVSFSPNVRALIKENSTLDHFEGMMTLLECHPINASTSLKSDELDFRMYLSYEVLLRQLGHARSIVANANALNHIGTSVSVRCMVELYAFVTYLLENGSLKDSKFMDKLLHGAIFSSGDWHPYEKIYK